MDIQHHLNDNNGSFFVKENNERLANMEYTFEPPSTMIIKHTKVSEKLAGKGIGKQMVRTAVEHARINHFKIIPLCPFTKAIIEKTPEFQDVLKN
jgi:predicted GNAT family acetyltransferase